MVRRLGFADALSRARKAASIILVYKAITRRAVAKEQRKGLVQAVVRAGDDLRVRHRDERRVDAREQQGSANGSSAGPIRPRAPPRPSTTAGALSVSASTPSRPLVAPPSAERVEPSRLAAAAVERGAELHGAARIERSRGRRRRRASRATSSAARSAGRSRGSGTRATTMAASIGGGTASAVGSPNRPVATVSRPRRSRWRRTPAAARSAAGAAHPADARPARSARRAPARPPWRGRRRASASR